MINNPSIRGKMSMISFALILLLTITSFVPNIPVHAGINDITANGYNIDKKFAGSWTAGNLGGTYEEGEWAPFQTKVVNLDWTTLDKIGVEFDFYGSGGRFYDLIRNISVGDTLLTDLEGFPDEFGNPAPLGTLDNVNDAQRNPDEYYFSNFTPIILDQSEYEQQINRGTDEGVGTEFDETRIFFITREQILEADPSLAESDTLVLYFQLHLSRTFIWNNTADFGGNELPLANVYTNSPTDKWGGYVYDENFLTTPMPGSYIFPGSSGHSYVFINSIMDSGKKTIPIPNVSETTGTISGYKYFDVNGDGIYDDGIDTPIPDWNIFLRTDLYAIPDVEFSTMTDTNGYYEFINLPYNFLWEVTEESQTDFSQTYPNSMTVGYMDDTGNEDTTHWKLPSEFGFMNREPWGWSLKLASTMLAQDNVNFYNTNTGALEVTKHIDWMGLVGDPGMVEFDITITGPSYLGGDTKVFSEGNLVQTWMNLIPGDYTVTEGDMGSEWTVTVPAGSVAVMAGMTAYADVYNDYNPGALEVTKHIDWMGLVGDPGMVEFDITITGPSYLGGDTKVFSEGNLVQTWMNLIPGDYTVTEGDMGSEWTVTVPAGSVAVMAGMTAYADVYNDYNPGALEVTKHIDWMGLVGDPGMVEFDITITGPSYLGGDTKVFSEGNLVQTWMNLIPGDYTVTEGDMGSEWTVTVPAGSVAVMAGMTAYADVYNDYNPGALEVTKHIDWMGLVGDPGMVEFDITITGPSYLGGDTKVFSEGNLVQTWMNLIPGDYTVTEGDMGSEWTVTVPAGSVAVMAGMTAYADVYNDYNPGALEVTKHIDWMGLVGDPGMVEFDITITGPSYLGGDTKVFSEGNLVQTWMNLIPGDYTVTEGDMGSEWTVTVPAGSVAVMAGMTAYADVYNDYNPGALEVTKHIDWMGLVGAPGMVEFDITITGPSYLGGDTKVFSEGNLVQTWMNLIPGDYTVTEGDMGSEWTVTVPAGSVAVMAGMTAYADVYNDYNPGALEVTKHIDWMGLVGDPGMVEFDITITGPSYLGGDTKVFSEGNLVQTWMNLIPGDYTVTEGDMGSEWTVTVPAGSVAVMAGMTAYADVYNDYNPGALEVTKHIDWMGLVGDPGMVEFDITITGPSYLGGDTKVFSEGNLVQTWMNLIPGDYTVTEGDMGSEWTVTVPAGSVAVMAGMTAYADVYNDYNPGALEVTKHIDWMGLVGDPGMVEFDITITGPSYLGGDTKVFSEGNLVQTWMNLIPGDYTVTEGDMGSEWTVTVPAGSVAVMAGMTAYADVYNDYNPGALQVTKHIDWMGLVGDPGMVEFDITITGPSYLGGDTKVFSEGNLVQTWMNLIPGDYTVTEGDMGSEWTVTVPAGSVAVMAGMTAYADVYNDYNPGALEVTKHIDWMGLVGDPGMVEFDITITGPSYLGGDTKVFSEGNLVQTWMNLIPGDYTVTEGDMGSEWTVTVPAGSVAVMAGMTAYADVYNDYNPGALEVTKHIDWMGLVGDPGMVEFDITITGPSYLGGDTKVFSEGNLVQTWMNLIPGDYTVTEGDMGSEWTVTVPAGSVAVMAGMTAYADVYNDYNPGALEVTKHIDWMGDISDPNIEFNITITGPSYLSGDTKVFSEGNLVQTWMNLIPGDYTVTEGDMGTQWNITVPAGPVAVMAGMTAYADVYNEYLLQYTDETAWGYLPEYAKTFDTVDSKLTNWGWTNGLITETGIYVLDLYAGAGDNNLSSGTLVGTVTLDYNKESGTAEVTYNTEASSNPQGINYEIIDTHLWIGNEPLPTLKNGKYVASPGQFKDDAWYVSNSDYTYVFSISDLDGDIYIAAHAVVRIYE